MIIEARGMSTLNERHKANVGRTNLAQGRAYHASRTWLSLSRIRTVAVAPASAGGEREVLPHVLRHFHSESQTAHGTQANRIINDVNVDVTHVGETALDQCT